MLLFRLHDSKLNNVENLQHKTYNFHCSTNLRYCDKQAFLAKLAGLKQQIK